MPATPQQECMIEWILNHHVQVITFDDKTITVNSLVSINGKASYEIEVIPFERKAIRAYLGY
jgi:hypothetical protein